jgi:phosphoribosylaminoimidazole (AIR) synthetase
MVLAVAASRAAAVTKALQDAGETVFPIGRIEPQTGEPVVFADGTR